MIEYHCSENICGCSVIVDNADSCYNDSWKQNGTVNIIVNPYTPEGFEVYNYSSSVGTLESHDYIFDVSTLECNNVSTFQYNYVCNLSIYNNSELYANSSLGDFQINGLCSGTTTTTSTTTTTEATTTTTEGTTTSTGGATTSTSGVTTSVVPGTTLYGYSLPDGNYGTLPDLNGTGGNTSGNGTLKNMPCTGFCIIGLNKEEFQLYASIMVIALILLAIKPFKLGATASAIALAFFNYILGWTAFTASLMLLFIAIAVSAWFTEGKQ
jgi:hypothetical protein